MTSYSPTFSYNNLSLCIYIGNTTSIDDSTLINYCSHFGTINFSSLKQENFCDFHLIEFLNIEQFDKFLKIKVHEINRIKLDIKPYKHILTNNDILNIDRKFYLGPILNSKDENIIVQFYKAIDPTLQYYLLKQNDEKYILFEFNNRQTITRIFDKQTIPITNDNKKIFLYKPRHPKEFVNKIISMKNKQNQIYIYGLNNQINQSILIEYFHKRAPVIACYILPNDPKRAIMEFNDKETIRKILDTSNIRLQGINLSISKASHRLVSLLSPTDNKDESDDDDDNEVKISHTVPISSTLRIQNQPPLFVLSSNYQDNSFISHRISPVRTPSPEKDDSGWSSPPRTLVTDTPAINRLSIPSSQSHATTNNINNDSTITDEDIKPIQRIPSNNFSRFVEQFESDIDQLTEEYRLKYEKDRKFIQQEINLLINEERDTFNKLNHYLIDHRKSLEKCNNSKRKHSSSSTQE